MPRGQRGTNIGYVCELATLLVVLLGQLYQRPFRLKFAPRCGNVAYMVRRVRIETLYQYKRVGHPVLRPQIEYFELI